jgi:integrase
MGVKVREKVEGSGEWWVFINHQGRRKAKRAGTGRSGRKATELAALKISARLAEGDTAPLDPPSAPTPVTALPTFNEYAERWLETVGSVRLRPSTVEQYRTGSVCASTRCSVACRSRALPERSSAAPSETYAGG